MSSVYQDPWDHLKGKFVNSPKYNISGHIKDGDSKLGIYIITEVKTGGEEAFPESELFKEFYIGSTKVADYLQTQLNPKPLTNKADQSYKNPRPNLYHDSNELREWLEANGEIKPAKSCECGAEKVDRNYPHSKWCPKSVD